MDLKIESKCWVVIIDQMCKKKSFHACIELTSIGGKKIIQDIVSVVTISRKEEIQNRSINKLKDCIIAKENIAITTLKNHVEDFLIGRHGIKGYRGYFKFVRVENANLPI